MADFFDKMKDSFNKGVATVSTGSKNMLEKTKINSQLRTLEEEKKQLAEILGNKIYQYCTENEEGDIPRDEVISFCNQITGRNEQIDVLKAKIEELDKEMSQVVGSSINNVSTICSCGHTNAPGSKFCGKCGSKLK